LIVLYYVICHVEKSRRPIHKSTDGKLWTRQVQEVLKFKVGKQKCLPYLSHSILLQGIELEPFPEKLCTWGEVREENSDITP